ncbi:MAG TPA: TetR/AcrR family transcriptional regulator [Kofleriaceae bacterium]|jgi:AcrR family transcriptional regulator|nr:TetR/AcrR family transcriptional regulator [Kofleriaceae bacterium]
MATRGEYAGPDPRSLDDLPVVLRPAREPDFRQDRARRSYLALIDAATALFTAHGYDAVGTPEIAQQAGVSVGTFYRYFTDKHEIYLEIARRTFVAGYHKTIADLGPERFAGRARHETISETIAILFDHVLSQPELTRSFREMSLRDPQVAEVARAFEQVAVARIATLITASVGRDVVPDPEATAWVLHAAVVEAAYSLAGHRGPPPISADRARSALTDFIERAIFPSS